MVIALDSTRAALVAKGLAGVEPLEVLRATAFDETQVAALAPDLVVIALDRADHGLIDALRKSSLSDPRPVVMFVDASPEGLAEAAVRAGVAAYVVDGLSPGRVRAVIEVATSRFRLWQEFREDLQRAREDLSSRKTVERAKALLMKDRGLSEDEAYRLLRKLSMDTSRPLGAVAADLLAFAGILAPDDPDDG